jgi:hypothetical protein
VNFCNTIIELGFVATPQNRGAPASRSGNQKPVAKPQVVASGELKCWAGAEGEGSASLQIEVCRCSSHEKGGHLAMAALLRSDVASA